MEVPEHLLLEYRTKLAHLEGAGGSDFLVTVWPGCGEASLSAVEGKWAMSEQDKVDRRASWLLRKYGLLDVSESNADRAARRARAVVRRYCRANELNEMVTLTFAGAPPVYSELSGIMRNFFRRVSRRAGESLGAYVWVPERGAKGDRLHVHMAVGWWSRLGVVEVCDVCALPGLRRKRSDIPAAGSFCVGCLWGWGFVARPSDGREDNYDGRSLSSYLSKYLAKDFEGVDPGRQRYRVGEGFKPVKLQVRAGLGDSCEFLSSAGDIVGGSTFPSVVWSDSWSGYVGPLTVRFDWREKKVSEQ